MNQQYEVRNPIEERSLFTYVFLVPAAMMVVTVLLYIFVFAAALGASTSGDTYGYGTGAVFGGGAALISVFSGVVCLAGMIYFLIIWTGVSRDINTMCQGDAQSSPLIPFAGAVAIVLIPFGSIYFFYYLYKMQDKMVRNAQRYGIALKWSPVAVLLFGIFISIVAYALLITSFNEMARAYNASYGLTRPEDENSDPGIETPAGGGVGALPVGGPGVPPSGDYGVATQGTLVCTAGESAGASIVMKEGESVILGRDPQISNVILRNDKKISRRHCTVTFKNGMFTVTDYSSNGTKLGNGQKVEHGRETPLGSQGVIKLSDQTEFRVQAN